MTSIILSKEDYQRSKIDMDYVQESYEKILGPPEREVLNSKGWLNYHCPFKDCERDGEFKLGVCYKPEWLGGFHCWRCNRKGPDLQSFYKQLDTPIDETTRYSTTTPIPRQIIDRQERKKQQLLEDPPLSVQQFSTFWKWIAQQSRNLNGYGIQYGGLREDHAFNLMARGIELDRAPQWFSVPPEDTLEKAIKKWGPIFCHNAGIYNSEKHSRRMAFRVGRIILSYPPSVFGYHNVPFGYLRSYNPICVTDLEKRYKMLSLNGYGSGRQLYIRARPDSRPNPWLVTEGEIKAECSYQAGVPTVGLGGMGVGHEELASLIIRSLIESDFKNPTGLIIGFDTEADPARQQKYMEPIVQRLIRKVLHAISQEFPNLIFPIYRNHIPTELGVKADIDSFVGKIASDSTLAEGRREWRNQVRRSVKNGSIAQTRIVQR